MGKETLPFTHQPSLKAIRAPENDSIDFAVYFYTVSLSLLLLGIPVILSLQV